MGLAVKKSTVKNFYRALAASAYVAGATAADLALGGPPGAAAAASAATTSLASPLGVTAVELAAEAGAEYAVGSEKMATGGIVTEPTFAMIGEAGPEMVVPLLPITKPKRARSKAERKSDKKMSRALEQANKELRKINGDLRKGITQADVMRRAHRIRKRL